MYNSYYNKNMYPNYYNNNDRVGGFVFPFVLGGITGGLLAPSFNQRPPRPVPGPNFYPYPAPGYPPYYNRPFYY